MSEMLTGHRDRITRGHRGRPAVARRFPSGARKKHQPQPSSAALPVMSVAHTRSPISSTPAAASSSLAMATSSTASAMSTPCSSSGGTTRVSMSARPNTSRRSRSPDGKRKPAYPGLANAGSMPSTSRNNPTVASKVVVRTLTNDTRRTCIDPTSHLVRRRAAALASILAGRDEESRTCTLGSFGWEPLIGTTDRADSGRSERMSRSGGSA